MELKAMESKREKRPRQIGSVNLNNSELPEIDSWQIKGEYEITLKVKMTSISEADKYEQDEYKNVNKNTVNARFEILGVNSPAKKQKAVEERGKLKNPVSIKLG